MKLWRESSIEKEFPVLWVNSLSVPERIALKPIYMMHRIFARRVGSVFRTIILSALKSENIEKEFYLSHRNDPDTNGVVILDPMAGGGTTLIEGSRLGAKVIGFEINPVPWFVTKCELTIINPKELLNEFKRLEKGIGRKIQEMYKTTCPNCSNNAEIVYTFWIKTINCPNCEKEIELFKDYVITYNRKGKDYFVLCPQCRRVLHFAEKPSESVKCEYCDFVFNPHRGNMDNKNYVICSACGNKFRLIDALKEKSEPLPIRQFAIDGWCPKCQNRFIKAPSEIDFGLYEKVKDEFEKHKNELLFPREEIPDGFNTNQMKNHNYRYWYQMFNERQLFALSLLLAEIIKIENEQVREIMLCVFSETLRSNNLFCYYDRRWAKQLTPLFARKDFAPVNFPLEQNVWGSKFGRGSFKHVFQRVLKGKEYNLAPFERKYEGKKIKRIYLDEKIGESPWELYCEDARNLTERVKTKVDLVITDPPYFDSVNYSEVYDFFYVWLRIALKDRYPWFQPLTTLNEAEAIVNEVQGKDRARYKAILKEIFKKSAGVLKDDGLFIFTFHDIEETAWWDMLEIVKDAGLSVKKIHFYHGENVSAGHFGGQKTVFDAIWVCRKELNKKQANNSKNVTNNIKIEVEKFARVLESGNFFKLDANDIRIFAIGKLIEAIENGSD